MICTVQNDIWNGRQFVEQWVSTFQIWQKRVCHCLKEVKHVVIYGSVIWSSKCNLQIKQKCWHLLQSNWCKKKMQWLENDAGWRMRAKARALNAANLWNLDVCCSVFRRIRCLKFKQVSRFQTLQKSVWKPNFLEIKQLLHLWNPY